jgi:IS30 family transposase
VIANVRQETFVPRYAPNKMPTAVKRRYFELICQGLKGAEAARRAGVSTSCGSLWFIDAGSVIVTEPRPISPRFLTQDDRIAIADGLRAGLTKKQIARQIGKTVQTVYREIARSSKPDGGYQPWWAHNQAVLRRGRPKPVKLATDRILNRKVRGRLDEDWSPQQIARWLARTGGGDPKRRVCTESIYRALFTALLGRINGKLRTGRAKRKRQRRGVARTNEIPNIRPISQRPAEVRDRLIVGHWERDLIIGRGQRSAIGTLVERTSRFLVLVHLPHGHKAPFVRNALIQHLQVIPHRLRKTLTWDRGRELFLHEQISTATGCDIYFCDPHAPWQRPTNENTNGLLRQYFPKSSDLTIHSASDLQAVAHRLNNRPRLVLGDRTPAEVMTQLLSTSNAT